MKPVLERCAELLANLEHLQEVSRNQDQAKTLNLRREELRALRTELAVASLSEQILRAHSHLSASELPDCSKALESCDRVRGRLEQDPTKLTAGRDYSYLLSRSSNVRDHLVTKNAEAWRAFTSQHQSVDEGFLRQVERVPGQAGTVEAIRKARRRLESAAEQVPTEEEGYQAFLTASTALQQALEKLNPSDFPEAVLQFFLKAQSPSGAPVELLTEEVMGWLRERGLLGSLRVKFKGDG
ncbi:MAG: hypothetical protein H6739_06600 [Alphaproteobacteria bacterium]|nr:hypothetical protein [Alphaproteobacteria bacterium]